MAPLICKKLPILRKPINERLLGKNKTYRGLTCGIIFGIITAYIQFLLKTQMSDINILNYDYWFLIGFLMGCGAMVGDLVESYFKRVLNKEPGAPWFPFDQLDFIVGALIFISIIQIPPLLIVLILVVLTPLLHLGTNYIAYKAKIKQVKW